MTDESPFTLHLNSADDLVTTYEARRAGFVALALERNRRATPFVEQARTLKVAASQLGTAKDLLTATHLQSALLTAAGLSDKSLAHLLPEDKTNAVRELIEQFLEPAGKAFAEELTYRFLLTRGDTLGGSMRNIGGAVAAQKWNRALLASLTVTGVPHQVLNTSGVWQLPQSDTALVRAVRWSSAKGDRALLYNVTVGLVKNNVDLVLLEASPDELTKLRLPAVLKEANRYVALGELKGGIDPAGADEHWKTARSALNRIRSAFAVQDLSPATFFIGSAIEKRMASEIWEELETGVLTNVANGTAPDQVTALCLWLTDL